MDTPPQPKRFKVAKLLNLSSSSMHITDSNDPSVEGDTHYQWTERSNIGNFVLALALNNAVDGAQKQEVCPRNPFF
jgi:hypothetical protein